MDTPWQTLTVATLLLQVLLALGALPSGESSNVVKPPELNLFDILPTVKFFPVPSPPPPTVKCGLPEDELELLVKKFNAHRLEVAKKDQIANMHEIRYDFELQKEMNESGICVRNDQLFCVKFGGRFFYSEDLGFGDPWVQNYPLITGFAFCTYRLSKSDPFKIFLYAPNQNYTNHVVSGPPGSQCPNGKAASGLCKAPWNTEITTLPPVPTTTQLAEEITNGAKLAYSICLILLVPLLVKKFH